MIKNSTYWITTIILCILILASILAGIFFNAKNDPANIFNNNILKTVEIKVSNDNQNFGYGTGCFISSDGLILTNKHMVYNSSLEQNYNIVKVRLANEEDFVDAQIISVSDEYDLATIKIEKTNCKYFKLTTTIRDGQDIYTIGNPNGFGLSFTKGNVSSKLKNVLYLDDTIQAIQTSFVINEGNSGGPVFNNNGNLVGLISFRLKDQHGDVIQGVSFAIPASIIQQFLA